MYLSLKKLKNGFLNILRKPAQLIFIVFIAALLILTIISGGNQSAQTSGSNFNGLFWGIVFLFYAVNMALVINQGFKQGGTLFKMPDVNLLFTSPINSISILFFGMFWQLVSYLIFNLFLLFQYSWMRDSFGINVVQLLIVILFFALMLLSSQLCSMLIYIFSAGNEKRKKLYKSIFIGLYIALAVYVLVSWTIAGGNALDFAARISTSTPVFMFPISGWLTAVIYGISTKNYILAVGFFAVLPICFILGLRLIKMGRSDYYEDVLVSTETIFKRTEEAKLGKIKDGAGKSIFSKNSSPSKIGLNKGNGASVLYFKHKLENRRKNPFILGWPDLIFVAVPVVFSFFVRDESSMIAVASMVFYMQLFAVYLGRVLIELQSHYIYLIPEKPFKKLLWAMMETIEKYPLKAILIAAPVAIIQKLSPLEAISFAFLVLGGNLLLLSLNLLVERIFGNAFGNSKGLMLILYFFALAISVAPGVFLGVVVTAVAQTSSIATAFFIISVWSLLISLLYTFLSRNILENAELR